MTAAAGSILLVGASPAAAACTPGTTTVHKTGIAHWYDNGNERCLEPYKTKTVDANGKRTVTMGAGYWPGPCPAAGGVPLHGTFALDKALAHAHYETHEVFCVPDFCYPIDLTVDWTGRGGILIGHPDPNTTSRFRSADAVANGNPSQYPTNIVRNKTVCPM